MRTIGLRNIRGQYKVIHSPYVDTIYLIEMSGNRTATICTNAGITWGS